MAQVQGKRPAGKCVSWRWDKQNNCKIYLHFGGEDPASDKKIPVTRLRALPAMKRSAEI